MGLPVKYIWTHDAFRVGEDGPTHQPVEQEAQLRLMEHLKNHKGENSMLALRPADATETTKEVWKMALENKNTFSAYPVETKYQRSAIRYCNNRFADALNSEKVPILFRIAQVSLILFLLPVVLKWQRWSKGLFFEKRQIEYKDYFSSVGRFVQESA